MFAPPVGLLVIATGPYLRFAQELLGDVGDHLAREADVTVNLFTDASHADVRTLPTSRQLNLNVVPVPRLRWPEASLHRYELFTHAQADIAGEVLIYLDADIRIARPFLETLTPSEWAGGLAAVRHPGFYRRRALRRRGSWESHRASVAYVPPWRRRTYVCGGVWMGMRRPVLDASRELAERVRRDSAVGITAQWHDESHWNWWVAYRKVHLLGPEYCWVPDYPWLAHLDPLICAVDKGGAFVREQTDDAARGELLSLSRRLVDDPTRHPPRHSP